MFLLLLYTSFWMTTRQERREPRDPQTYTPRPQIYTDFLSRQAPLNYIAGLGRGAAGLDLLLNNNKRIHYAVGYRARKRNDCWRSIL